MPPHHRCFVDSEAMAAVGPSSPPSPVHPVDAPIATTSADVRPQSPQDLSPLRPVGHRAPAPAPAPVPVPVPVPVPASASASAPASIDAAQTSDASIVPALVRNLTCNRCRHLFFEPTTLSCGHATCLGCAAQSAMPILRRRHSTNSAGSSPARSRRSASREREVANTDEPSAATSLLASILNRTSSSPEPDPLSPPDSPRLAKQQSSLARNRPRCSHPDCIESKRSSSTHTESKVDYVLQKVVSLVRRSFPGIDVDAALDADETDEEEEEHSSELAADAPPLPTGRSDSTSSASSFESEPGGEGNDVSTKRGRRTQTTKCSNKRVRSRKTVTNLEDRVAPPGFIADLQSELECQICVQLFHNPITSPCGHTFCQKCLARSLDHSDKCPLCRCDFPSFTYLQETPPNATTVSIIEEAFPVLLKERKLSIAAEEKSSTLDTPIFVCTLAWPNLPTYLHIFEPRYRLMLRRVMEGDRHFGMVLPSRHDGGIHEFGTMLYVQSCSMIEDGRSIVETIGAYRFRILEKGSFDGYTVGRIERIDDISADQEAELERLALATNPEGMRDPLAEYPIPAPGQPQIELSTHQLVEICLKFVQMLRSGSAPWVLQRLNNTIGPMPEDPADFSFWMAEVMPVDDHVKAALLQITSPRERLRLIVFWIEQFRSSWWFSRGCSVM